MVSALIEDCRKTCKLCNSYRTFKAQDNSYRQKVENDLQKLQLDFTDAFEEMRRQSNTSDEQVRQAKQNKYFCMDLIQVCRGCDRDEPRVSDELKKIQ